MKALTGVAIVMVVLVVAVLASVSLRDAGAQDAPRGELRPMGPMPFPPMGPPGGGGIAMIVYNDMIYIAQDGVLYKINPQTMALEGELRYLRPGLLQPPKPPAPPGVEHPR